MKRNLLFLSLAGMAMIANAQSVSPEVIATSGDYYENANISISWSLGEVVTETFTGASIILTQGFQQPFGIQITGIDLDLMVFLEGSFAGSEMVPALNTAGLIPLSQPYNTIPWNYAGSESVGAIPNPDVVDWVLIELRDAPNAGSATGSTQIAMQAAFLLRDGSVVGLDGSSILQFNSSVAQQLFVIVWHRNHLGIMSANGVLAQGGIFTYNFSLSATQVHGGSLGYKQLPGGLWGMVAGDSNHDGLINITDKSEWAAWAGKQGYINADFTMDGQVNNPDKDDRWVPNTTKTGQVPD